MKFLKKLTKANCLFMILIIISSYFILQRYMAKRSMILEGMSIKKPSDVKIRKKIKFMKKDMKKKKDEIVGFVSGLIK